MDLTNKKYLYANGSSVTAAGGFEEYKYRKSIRDKYTKKGIDLPESQLECSIPYFVSKELGLECINDSKSGLGLEGLIRTTFDWMRKNKSKFDKTIFLIEVPAGVRVDLYIKEWGDYGLLNAAKNEKGEYPFTLGREWFKDDPDEHNKWNHDFYEPITQFFNNFYDEDIFRKSEDMRLLFFLSYLELKGIDYFISLPHLHSTFVRSELDKIVPKHKNLNILLNDNTIWRYCEINNWLISDEIEDGDAHPGYIGSQKMGEVLSKIINKT